MIATLAVIALPLLAALVVLLLRRFALVSSALAGATFLAIAVLAVIQAGTPPLEVMGRTVALSPFVAATIAFGAGLMAVVMLYACTAPHDDVTHPLALAATGFLVGACAVQNVAVAGLLLQTGAILAAALLIGRGRLPALLGARATMAVTFMLPLLLLAARTFDASAHAIDGLSLVQAPATMSLALVAMLGMGLFPFHVWQAPLYRRGNSAAIVMVSVLLTAAMLVFTQGALRSGATTTDRLLLGDLLLAAGLASAVFGGVAALTQSSLMGVLGHAALADLGIAMLGYGLGLESTTRAANLHLVYRGLGVAAVAMGGELLAKLRGSTEFGHLRGVFQQAPLTVVGATVGALSIAGLPLTAGFSTRLLLLEGLARTSMGWAAIVACAGIGPLWALARCVRLMFALAYSPNTSREHPLAGAIVLAIGLVLVVLGLCPNLAPLTSTEWLGAAIGP